MAQRIRLLKQKLLLEREGLTEAQITPAPAQKTTSEWPEYAADAADIQQYGG